MAKTKGGDNENILVKVDQNNLMYIDPNSVVEQDGTISPRNLKQENLVMYVNLEADIIPRSILVADNNQSTLTSIAKGTLNFLRNQNGKEYDTSWSDSYYTTTEKTIKDETGKIVGTGEFTQFDGTGQSFGIESISINIKGFNSVPEVQITFQDIRGKTLFESPENSPYQAFFHLPWPIYYLTIKGFYGKAIRYRLHLVKMSSKFIDSTGNFQILTNFVGSTYAYLSDIPLKGILHAPYMYMVENTRDTNENPQTGTKIRKISRTSKGYATLRAVYSEYKQKGLIPKDFPVKTLKELITIAQNLDRILEQEITNQVVDARLFVAIKSFDDTINKFIQSVNAWAKIRLTQTFNTALNGEDGITGIDYYILSQNNKTNPEFIFDSQIQYKEGTLQLILENYKKLLKENELFAKNIANNMGGDFTKEKIFVRNLGPINDYYRIKNGQYEVAIDKLLDDIYEIKKTFESQKSSLQNAIEIKMNEILKDKSKGGFGFDPTIKNIFAVILANAEVYIRLLKDVHVNAFEQAQNRKSLIRSLSNETKGDEAIYPWPEIKKNTGGTKQKIIAYPGDTDLISTLNSNNQTYWPEVFFVENFIDVATNRLDSNTDKESGVDKIQYSFEEDLDKSGITNINTSLYVADTLSYENIVPASFLYELYERANLFTLFESFNNKALYEIAEIEFENIKETTKGEDEIIEILNKKVAVISNSANNYEKNLNEILRSYSPFERYPYFEDNLPTTTYLKNLLETSHKIQEYISLPSIPTTGREFPQLKDNLQNYYPTDYRKNIYPFNSQTYLNYLNQNNFTNDELKINGALDVKINEGFIVSPIEPLNYVKLENRNNLFTNKLKIGTDTKTNILNTPYFHNQLFFDFQKSGSYGKYAGSAYLLLNSLPFYDLEDKITFDNIASPIRMSTLFREVGASHYLPYHLIIKWGSIYHRYKKYILEEKDILEGAIDNTDTSLLIDGAKFFNNNESGTNYQVFSANGILIKYKYSLSPTPTPTSSSTPTVSPSSSAAASPSPTPTVSPTSTATPSFTPSQTPSMTVTSSVTPSISPTISPTSSINSSPSPTPSATPSITPSITPTSSPIFFDDAGVHPYYDAIFHQIINNYTHYIIQSGNTSFSANVTAGAIKTKYRTEPNNIKYWTSYVDNSKFDTKDLRYTVLPCDGDNFFLNRKKGASTSRFRNASVYEADTFDRTVQNNFRCVWEDDLINDEYSGATFPSYDEYHRSYVSGDTKTFDNLYSIDTNYRKIIDLIGTFNPKILDEFESMFLDFASAKVFSGETYNQFSQIKYTKFQDLLKEIVSVEKKSEDGTDVQSIVREIKLRQYDKLIQITKNITSSINIIKLTISNPKEINSYVYKGFIKDVDADNVSTLSYNGYDITQSTSENLSYIDLYLGEDIDGYYEEFFVTNNIELNEDNILELRSIILIYAGYRKTGGTANTQTFKNYIRDNIFYNTGANTRRLYYINSLCPQFLKLKPESNVNSLRLSNGYNNSDLKLELYNMFKSFNDKWIAGNSIGQRTLLEEFLFLDKANKDIGDKVYLDISKLLMFDDYRNNKANLYSALGALIDKSGWDMRAMPAYVNFYGTNFNNKSKIIPSKKVASNLFGTFLEVDYQESSPKILLQLVGQTSKHLADMNKKYKFADDTFNVSNTNNNPLIITLPQNLSPEELYKSNRVVAFEVSFGDQNQSIFKGVQLDQTSIKNTSESFVVLENLGRTESGSGAYNVDTSLFEYYRQASYSCEVTCLGNVMIQPTMYFYLKNIPMFRGTYWITEVSHSIQNNNITTTFKGTRIPYASLPDPKDSFMSSYRPLFDKILKSLESRINQSDTTRIDTNITFKNKNGVSNETDIVKKLDSENIPNDLVAAVGTTAYGVPYNGAQGEKYIQLIKYKNEEYLRGIVVQFGGPNYELDDVYSFGLVGQLQGADALLWEELKKTTTQANFYSTPFKIDRPNGITPEKIISATTTFINPINKLKVEVAYSTTGVSPNRIINGPVGIGPKIIDKIDEKTGEPLSYKQYSVGMSKKLMQSLKLVDGDIVYFKLV